MDVVTCCERPQHAGDPDRHAPVGRQRELLREAQDLHDALRWLLGIPGGGQRGRWRAPSPAQEIQETSETGPDVSARRVVARANGIAPKIEDHARHLPYEDP